MVWRGFNYEDDQLTVLDPWLNSQPSIKTYDKFSPNDNITLYERKIAVLTKLLPCIQKHFKLQNIQGIFSTNDNDNVYSNDKATLV